MTLFWFHNIVHMLLRTPPSGPSKCRPPADRWGSGQKRPIPFAFIFNPNEWIRVATKLFGALAGVAQWIERGLQTKKLPVRFPVRAHVWVAGPGPHWGPHERQPHIDVSLSFSLPSPLSENK